MLSKEILQKIEDFVYSKPRSIQEIADYLGKNWRTADRYIEEISKEYGTISTRVFRPGSRGAIKIVFWSAIEKASHSIFQEQLEKDIFDGKKKEDFSPFDVFQHVSDSKKKAQIQTDYTEEKMSLNDLKNFLNLAKKQILIFSGNLSFINFHNGKTDILEVLESLIEKGVSLKVICRVDIAGKENIQRLLDLNFKYARECVEIRHKEQPLRAIVIDNKIARLKEVKEPTGRANELKKKTFIFYTLTDKDWSEWFSKIFWKMFSSSIDSNKRIKEMDKIRY